MTYQMYNSDMPDANSLREMEDFSKAMTANSKNDLVEEHTSEQVKRSIVSSLSSEGSSGQREPEEPWRSISFSPQVTKLVFYKILAYILICFLTIQNLDRYEQARNMIKLLIYMGVFQAAYGIVDALSGHNYIFSYYKTSYQGTATGTFINRNHLAGYLEMIIPLALAYFLNQLEKQRVERRENWRQRLFSLETVFSKYAFLLFLVVIMAIAILFSQSRMGIMGMMSSFAFMGLTLSWHSKGGHDKIFLVVIGVVLLLGVVSGLEEIMHRFEAISREVETEASRASIWRDSLKIFHDYPLLGIGSGNYPYLFPKYKAWLDPYFYDHAHNDYVEMLVESGLVGTGIFLTGVIYFAFIGLRFLKREQDSSRWTVVLGGLAGLLAITLHGITDFNMQIPANAILFFFLLGLTYRIMEFKGEKVKVRVKRGHKHRNGED